MTRFKVLKVDRVEWNIRGKIIEKFNVSFREVDNAGVEYGPEFIVGCNNDKPGHVKAKIKKMMRDHHSPPETPPSHPLEGEEYEA